MSQNFTCSLLSVYERLEPVGTRHGGIRGPDLGASLGRQQEVFLVFFTPFPESRLPTTHHHPLTSTFNLDLGRVATPG